MNRVVNLFLGLVAMVCAQTAFAGLMDTQDTTSSDVAGETLETAHLLDGGTTTVLGYLDGDADIFAFYWDGGEFDVTAMGYGIDVILYLLASDGTGLFANDDASATSAGNATILLDDLDAGLYFLAVSSWSEGTKNSWEDATQAMQSETTPLFSDILEADTYEDLVTSTGTLSGWMGSGADGFYALLFSTEVATAVTTEVPNIGTLLLFLSGGLLLWRRRFTS